MVIAGPEGHTSLPQCLAPALPIAGALLVPVWLKVAGGLSEQRPGLPRFPALFLIGLTLGNPGSQHFSSTLANTTGPGAEGPLPHSAHPLQGASQARRRLPSSALQPTTKPARTSKHSGTCVWR